MPIFLPNLKRSFLDHPLRQGLLRPSRRLCSPTLAPTPKSPKKPKIQTSGDMFPTDWSPPPVEFLNPRLLQSPQDTPGQRWVGVSGPEGLRRLPKELAQDPLGFDPKEGLDSLEELFWNMAGPSQQAATPETDDHASVSGSYSLASCLCHLSLVTPFRFPTPGLSSLPAPSWTVPVASFSALPLIPALPHTPPWGPKASLHLFPLFCF